MEPVVRLAIQKDLDGLLRCARAFILKTAIRCRRWERMRSLP
jgi:hypothetical protein